MPNYDRKAGKAVESMATSIQNVVVALFKVFVLALSIAWTGAEKIDWKRGRTYTDAPYLLIPAFLATAPLAKTSLLVGFGQDFLPPLPMEFLAAVPWTAHFGAVSLGTVFFLFVALGIGPYQEIASSQEAIDSLGLKTGTGRRPKVVSVTNTKNGKKTVLVSSYGIGPEAYKSRIDDLQSGLGGRIGTIRRARNPRFVEITVTGRELPGAVNFSQLGPALREPGQFLVGFGEGGEMNERIDALPHLLVAGTTGGGKSVFFKQALLGLLTSTEKLQMYLIDLKGGLEFREFGTLPNVEVVKNIEGAVGLLEVVKREMEKRFDYLEKEGKEKIDPKKDKFDRIVVGIDEASVLYSPVSRDDEDYGYTVKARGLTDRIAKLSRAAGIHLIMATQRVTKETIDTRIQENVSGRMCFKLNTLEGSLRVLGNKSACDLPNIPGRGIWQLGSKMAEVQTPFIDNKSLKEKIGAIGEKYRNGERSLHRKMLQTANLEIAELQKNDYELKDGEESIEDI